MGGRALARRTTATGLQPGCRPCDLVGDQPPEPDGTADAGVVVDVGVVVTVPPAAPPLVPAAEGICVVGGSRTIVYFVPSAVFCSVTGVPRCSVIVGAPLAYEPPATAIFAVFAVSETRWKSAPRRLNVTPLVGKSLATATLINSPLSEMIALVGAAAAGEVGVEGVDGAAGVAVGALDPPVGFPGPAEGGAVPPGVTCVTNGSFVANFWNCSS
jgi:hypothetical protein